MKGFPAAILLIALACSQKDPFDSAAIEKDLKKRTAQDLYDEAEKFKFEKPADRRLTETQVTDFVRMSKLAARIREIAEHRLNEQADRAANADGRFSRLGESFAAVGSLRSYATAELRACLDLGLNPKEQQWVAAQIASASSTIEDIFRFDKNIESAKAEADAEIDPFLASRKRAVYDQAVETKRQWEERQDPAALANAERVRKHRHELIAASPVNQIQ